MSVYSVYSVPVESDHSRKVNIIDSVILAASIIVTIIYVINCYILCV